MSGPQRKKSPSKKGASRKSARKKAEPVFSPEDIPSPAQLTVSDQAQQSEDVIDFLKEVKAALESGGRLIFASNNLPIATLRYIQDILKERGWDCDWELGNGPPLARLQPVPTNGTIREIPRRGLFKRWKKQRYEIYDGHIWRPYPFRRQ